MTERAFRQITWAITMRCFLVCRHCLVEASPSGLSMNSSDAKRVIGHLPKDDVYNLELTGGDPFADYALLITILEGLGGKKETRRVTIHTTGQWATSDNETRSRFRQIKSLGADGIDFLCDDEFHFESGLIRSNYDRAVLLAGEVFGPEGAYVRKPDLADGIIPIGRGADVSLKEHWGKSSCNVRTADIDTSMQVHITHTGDAFACDNEVAPPLGSIVENSYEELIDIARQDPRHQALLASGPIGIVRVEGLDEDFWSARIDEVGECRTCTELFRYLKEHTPATAEREFEGR